MLTELEQKEKLVKIFNEIKEVLTSNSAFITSRCSIEGDDAMVVIHYKDYAMDLEFDYMDENITIENCEFT